jgi:hypothetical protein
MPPTDQPTDDQPFFDRAGDGFVPREHASSPWSPDMLHGRLLAGLAARAIEVEHGDSAFQFVRLTVDLFRSPPLAAVEVTTVLARNGRRVRAADAVISSGGLQVARASALLLRRGQQPADRIWRAPEWSVPGPDDVPPLDPVAARTAGFELRPITPGGFATFDQRRVWMRDRSQLVSGEPMSPFVRIATAADFANPLTNFGENRLEFINADLSLFLHRLPTSDWLGFEVAGHLSEAGVAVGNCTVYDLDGAVGYCAVCAVANQSLAPPAS